MKYYSYECNWFDDDDDYSEHFAKGIVHAEDYAEAMRYISTSYGETNLIEVKLSYETDDLIYEITSEGD